LKHTDDDGELSLFASGNELLIACNRGHFWTLKASQGHVEGAVRQSTSAATELDDLVEQFGEAAPEALGF